MKILQLCNKIPYPPKDGGAIAMLSLSEEIVNQGHELVILAMNTGKHNFKQDNIPQELKDKILFIYTDVDTRIRIAALIKNLLLSKLPYNAERFINAEFEQRLTELITKTDFDIIQLEGLYLSHYIPVIQKNSKAKIVYRAHNIESEIWGRVIQNYSRGIKYMYLKVLRKRLLAFEKSVINKYDLLVPIASRDAETLIEWGNTKPYFICPTGILKKNFSNKVSIHSTKKLFFIGALDWIPNQEGIEWFLRHVWHELKKVHPAMEFHIAGRNAPKKFEKRLGTEGIIYHGEIESSKAFFDANDIMIVPLFAGSGIRIKILEAMARSKVVVTTPIGAEGLGIEDGKQAIISEYPEILIEGITKLYSDDTFFAKMQENALVYTRNNFRNDKLVNNLLNFFKQNLTC